MSRLKHANKDIIWSFAYELNQRSKRITNASYEISLANYKNDEGYYELSINGKEHKPKTKREVYEILRKVDNEYTGWWEECNAHYFEDK